jgi:hypothetical protein
MVWSALGRLDMYSYHMDCDLLLTVDLLPWKRVLVIVDPCLGCFCLARDDFSALLLQYFML